MTKQRGSLSAFVVSITMACIVVVGFVVDSGRQLAQYVSVADVAQNAARIGAQAVFDIRLGAPRIDTNEARTQVQRYLSTQGYQGDVVVTENTVTVQISHSVEPMVLGMVGVRSKVLRVSRTAVMIGG